MITMQYSVTLFNATFQSLRFHQVLTEMGVCYTYGGIVANLISLKYHKPFVFLIKIQIASIKWALGLVIRGLFVVHTLTNIFNVVVILFGCLIVS